MKNLLDLPTSNTFQIEEIDEKHALRLSKLAQKIYPQHYTHLWHDKGAWYSQMSFDPARLKTELENPNSRFFIAKDLGGNDLGFLKINQNYPLSKKAFSEAFFDNLSLYDPKICSNNALELERIYLLKEAQGTGLGRILTELTFAIAAELKRDCVWLKVMDSSVHPIAFYEKMGFVICGSMRLALKGLIDEMRGMYVMKKEV